MAGWTWKFVAAVSAAGMLLGGCGGEDDKAAPATTSTTISQIEADKRKAQQAQLTAADVPGYAIDTSAPAEEDDETGVSCFANNALVLRLGETSDTRGASSPTFGKDDVLEVSSAVTFAENVDEARAAVAVFTAPSFAGCFSRAWREAMTGEGFTNVTATTAKLPAVTAGEESIGLRTVGRGRANGRAVTLNLDFTLFRVDRAVGMVVGSGVNTTVPEADRTRLVTTVAGRLAP